MDSRTNPMAPDPVGDSSVDGEIAGEQEPLKTAEGGAAPPPGALDDASPATDPTGDPGRLPGSRDPDAADSVERDNRPGGRDGGTPYDAEGAAGSEGE